MKKFLINGKILLIYKKKNIIKKNLKKKYYKKINFIKN